MGKAYACIYAKEEEELEMEKPKVPEKLWNEVRFGF